MTTRIRRKKTEDDDDSVRDVRKQKPKKTRSTKVSSVERSRTPKKELEELLVPDAEAFRTWLSKNHAKSPGVWLVFPKKGGNVTSLKYKAALDEALCFGWIDGQASSRDEGSYRQRFTPRRPKSNWSLINVNNVERLTQCGRMAPPGILAVESAKSDGRWAFALHDHVGDITQELMAGLSGNPRAMAMYNALTSVNRHAILHKLNVKTVELRIQRAAEFVKQLENHETIFPQKRMPVD